MRQYTARRAVESRIQCSRKLWRWGLGGAARKMAFYLDLFSPETYEAFSRSGLTVSGFRLQQRAAAKKIKHGDKLICYMTKLSRWVGVLQVVDGPYEDSTPMFYLEDDPFVLRFR